MATAEVKTAWQCVNRRCFIQEDARRASKLGGYSSTLSSSQDDPSGGDTANESCESSSNIMSIDLNSANTSIPSDTKWWLQVQPNCVYQKHDLYKHVYELDDKFEEKTIKNADFPSKHGSELPSVLKKNSDNDENSYEQSPKVLSTMYMKHSFQANFEELKAVSSKCRQPLVHKTDLNTWYDTDQLMDQIALDQLIPNKPDKNCSNPDQPFVGDGKPQPFWQTADKEELTSFVARRAAEHIENCDLPRTEKMCIGNDTSSSIKDLDEHVISSSPHRHHRHSGLCRRVSDSRSISQILDENRFSCNALDHTDHVSKKLSRNMQAPDVKNELTENLKRASENETSKAQLLEALCHSQTRARKAEIAAQKAYNEKDHLIKLFLKQASHLFAYKQWIRILQLESLCLQLKIKENQLSSLFPNFPWMPLNGNYYTGDNNLGESRRRGRKYKKCHGCRYVLAFAVGVGLVGAGLLLGWTMGWLFSMI